MGLPRRRGCPAGVSLIVARRIASISRQSLGFASPRDRVSPLRDGAIDGFAISGNHITRFDLQPCRFTGLTCVTARLKDPQMIRPLPIARLLLLTVLTGSVAQAAEFTPDQRAEIVTIVRDALKQDPSILRDAVVALQADEGERSQAAARAAIGHVQGELVSPADPVVGDPHGDVTIVEFFDTRCPYCRKMEPVMDSFLLQDRKVRLVYKDLPILGPASVLGTKALLAAQKQDAYTRMREAVMKLPPDTTLPQIETAARGLGLDWPRMARDMDDPAVQARIDANLKLAHTLGIQGTPALVIGSDLIPGAVDLPELQKAVAEARRG
jgi:protein-disulfide isomerase